MSNLNELIKTLEEARKAATQGEWIFGGWTIYDEDREAQNRKEPYWTLENNSDGYLCVGPIGRKSLDAEVLISGCGYDCNGLNISKENAQFITLSANLLPQLISEVKKLQSERAELLGCVKWYAGNFDGKEGTKWIKDTFFFEDKFGSGVSVDGEQRAHETLKQISEKLGAV